jgi:hypothetical protein
MLRLLLKSLAPPLLPICRCPPSPCLLLLLLPLRLLLLYYHRASSATAAPVAASVSAEVRCLLFLVPCALRVRPLPSKKSPLWRCPVPCAPHPLLPLLCDCCRHPSLLVRGSRAPTACPPASSSTRLLCRRPSVTSTRCRDRADRRCGACTPAFTAARKLF